MTRLFGLHKVLRPLLATLPLALTGGLSIAQTSQTTATHGQAIVWQTPQDGGARRWQVVSEQIQVYQSASSTARLIHEFERGVVLSNLGCSLSGDERWCQVRPFRGGVRGFALAKHLEPARGPDGIVAMGENDTKRRARRRDFDATTTVRCAQEQGQELGKCEAAVARTDGGDATLVVTFSNGFARQLYFVHGEFVRANATMSGVGTDTAWQLNGGDHRVRVDDQQFVIPHDFVVPD